MKKSSLLFCLLLTVSSVGAQKQYEPVLVILKPNKIIVHEVFKKQIDSLNSSISERLKNVDWKEREKSVEKEFKDEEENIRIMELKKLAFMKEADYFSNLSSISELFLQFKLFPDFENLMIYAVTDKVPYNDTKSLNLVSIKHDSHYVLNFSEVELLQSEEGKRCRITIQLFDKKKNEIVLSKKFIGDDKNPGFEFACETGTIECTISNSLASALPEVIKTIYENNSSVQKKKNLFISRNEVLLNDYYLIPSDNLIPEVLQEKDQSLPIKNFYQGILNSEKNKFISFFIIDTEGMSFKDLINKKEKMNVEILSNSFGEVPNMMGFLVIGIKNENKWVLKKKKITYFDSNDIFEARKQYFSILLSLDFFKSESIEINPNFWNTDLFKSK
ncbi:hypothetical protein AAON49_05090 [Pseudotenacibaculum sp. MALMAid0570]|uniref:hypothetical protein n=1 Tax=Pseudotenacibaculum sp. MALMAid0570 TaxID=3143938 RepID=UPI0032E04823